MAVYYNTNFQILIDGFSIAGYAKQAELAAMVNVLDTTNLASAGWKAGQIGGLAEYSFKVSAMQDMATTGPDATLPGVMSGTARGITIMPTNGGASNADVAFFGTAVRTTTNPLMGSLGELAMADFGWVGQSRLVRGQVIHPTAARTSSSNGSAVAFTAPTASQSLYAAFQVTAVSGTGTITFTIQTDDNSGFTSSTTRITSSALTGVGSEVDSLAGSLSGETYVRAGWTISGFTSVTFNVAVGVGSTTGPA